MIRSSTATSKTPGTECKGRFRPTRAGIAILAFALSALAILGAFALPASAARSRAAGSKTAIGSAVQILRPFAVRAPSAGEEREHALGLAALATLRFNPEETFPGWTIVFRSARSGTLGMTLVQERRVEIYVRLSRPVAGVAHDIAHELGHVTDVVYNTDETRGAYLALRNQLPTTPWWTCSGCRDLEVGAGDFAETFARWAAPRFRFYSELAPAPSEDSMAAFATLLPSMFVRGATTGGSATGGGEQLQAPLKPDAGSQAAL